MQASSGSCSESEEHDDQLPTDMPGPWQRECWLSIGLSVACLLARMRHIQYQQPGLTESAV
jgi:hypothetical protein